MNYRKQLITLGLAGCIATFATCAMAQGTATPGASPAPNAGVPGAGGVGAMPTGPAPSADTTTSPDATTGKMPKAGGDPLTITAAGSFLVAAGYGIRRRIRRA